MMKPPVKPDGGYPRTTGKKWCRICRRKKEADAFHSDGNSWDGLQPKCKPCNNKLARKDYAARADEIKARRRERYRLQQEAKGKKVQSSLLYKVGDQSRAVCSCCKVIKTTTAVQVLEKLVFVCNECGNLASIPQQSFPVSEQLTEEIKLKIAMTRVEVEKLKVEEELPELPLPPPPPFPPFPNRS